MKVTTREVAVFAMLGAIMFASKMIMEIVPNVHLLGTFVIAYTVCYGKKALYPIYVFVLLTGVYAGFATWWVPYLYLWTVLWGVTMLLPKNMPKRIKPLVYMMVCAMHGFLYGILYAPAQAFFFGLNWEGTIAWIMTGLPWDFLHGISNFFCGMLILPIVRALRIAEGTAYNGS